MTTVTEELDLAGGVGPQQASVSVFLAGEGGEPLPAGYAMAAGKTVVGVRPVKVDDDGVWTVDLIGNDDITPSGTVWGLIVSSSRSKVAKDVRWISVPTTGGPYEAQSLLVDPPGSIDPTGLALEVAARIAADNALQAQIDAEEAARIAADAALQAEIDLFTLIDGGTPAGTGAGIIDGGNP